PDDRYPSAHVLIESLDAARRVLPRRPRWWQRCAAVALKPGRLRLILTGLLLAATACALLAVAGIALQRQGHQAASGPVLEDMTLSGGGGGKGGKILKKEVGGHGRETKDRPERPAVGPGGRLQTGRRVRTADLLVSALVRYDRLSRGRGTRGNSAGGSSVSE